MTAMTAMTARFGVGRVIATSVRIWGRNLPRFIAITALVYVPLIAWNAAGEVDALREVVASYHGWLSTQHLVLRVLPDGRFVVFTCAAVAVTHGALVALTGKPAPIGGGLSTAVRRFFPVIGVSLVAWVTDLVVDVLHWFVWPQGVAAVLLSRVLTSLILPSLFYLVVPVATAERRAVVGSIVRGFALARGRRIRVFAIVIVEQVVWGGLYWGTAVVVLSDRGSEPAARLATLVLYRFVVLGLRVVVSSFGTVMAAVTYRLLREDQEGQPAEVLAEVFE